MSRYFKQLRTDRNRARKLLDERLARRELGDAEYEKMISAGNDPTFRIVGLVLIMSFGLIVLVWTALGR